MEIANDVWDLVEAEIQKICHGTVSLIVQDGRLIQLDKAEKIRLNPRELAQKTGVCLAAGQDAKSQSLRIPLAAALKGVRFGQVVVVLKDGNVVQIERVEKQRVNDWMGFGAGI
ncbi:MAG: YezD family protein [Negativicutes bacterium]|nr:YezD family protein [Negativicutes bacterium]